MTACRLTREKERVGKEKGFTEFAGPSQATGCLFGAYCCPLLEWLSKHPLHPNSLEWLKKLYLLDQIC